jgi:hypothetical protein
VKIESSIDVLKWAGQYLQRCWNLDNPQTPLPMFMEMNNSMDDTMWSRPAQTTPLFLTMCVYSFVTLIVWDRQWECGAIKCAKSRWYSWHQSNIVIR